LTHTNAKERKGLFDRTYAKERKGQYTDDKERKGHQKDAKERKKRKNNYTHQKVFGCIVGVAIGY
jgi:hypothetical protein